MSSSFFTNWHDAAVTSLGLFWTALWAFCLGYLISAMIQVFVTRERMQQLMGQDGPRSMVLGTFFGFVSSSCSFAALSGARALFAKGAGLAPSLAFLLSSTNLVIELGIIIAIFLSWQFVVAEYVGGLILILIMWFLVHFTSSLVPVEAAREHARQMEASGDAKGCHHHGGGGGEKHQHQDHPDDETHKQPDDEIDGNENENHHHNNNDNNNKDDADEEQGETGGAVGHCGHDQKMMKQQQDDDDDDDEPDMLSAFFQMDKWRQVAMHYYMEWSMVWKDVSIGFTVTGIIAAFVPRDFFEWLFIGGDNPNFGQLLEQCLVGPVAAFATFIGSMGNIPLAAVLYSNGVSFAGIIAFIFSDLVVLPVIRVNASYYGWTMALYILGIFLIALVVTALILHYVFEAIGILPSEGDAEAVVGADHFQLNYTFVLNILLGVMSIFLFGWHFKEMGWSFSMGSSVTEILLFWLTMISYLWIMGGLFAGLA